MASPRTKALSTRLLLLLEVHNGRHARLRTLAERLDVTVQAVSDYLKRLTNEGLVENVSGAWRPTKRGTALLHETIRDLERFLQDARSSLRLIEDTFAVADRTLRAEQEVGLFMRDGRLYAGSPRGAPSRGRTRTAAAAGHLVLVGDLRGLLNLHPAPFTFVAHPDFPAGPALERARRQVKRLVDGRSRVLVAAHGETSLAWVWALGLEVDLEFAPLVAAREAAQRGVPIVYFVPEGDRARCEAEIRQTPGAADEPIPIRSLTL